jgi:hypothetical protein
MLGADSFVGRWLGLAAAYQGSLSTHVSLYPK